MLPTIGVMIGVYIICRMIEIISLPDRHLGVKIFAGITALVAAVSIYDLLQAGTNASTFPTGF